tara:strand:- start:220 stop:705 length:486 start_codon:yes stop_codon:yes gene_type:complete
MSELTRAHDTSTAAVAHDGVVGDVKEADEDDITKGVEALKIEEPPPLTATIVPTGSISGADLLGHFCKANDEIARLKKENTDLKREIEVLSEFEMQKMKAAAIGSASVGGNPMVNPYKDIENIQHEKATELKIAALLPQVAEVAAEDMMKPPSKNILINLI